jgi:hypothetical protein
MFVPELNLFGFEFPLYAAQALSIDRPSPRWVGEFRRSIQPRTDPAIKPQGRLPRRQALPDQLSFDPSAESPSPAPMRRITMRISRSGKKAAVETFYFEVGPGRELPPILRQMAQRGSIVLEREVGIEPATFSLGSWLKIENKSQ